MTDEPASERPAEPKASRKERHWGNLAAGFSAACALALSAYTAFLQRQQVKAQVWPLLSWAITAFTGDEPDDAGPRADAGGKEKPEATFSFEVRNKGVGPAIVRAMEVTVDGKPVRQWDDVLTKIAPPSASRGWGDRHISMVHARVMAAGETSVAFQPDEPEVARALFRAVDRIGVTICYCSVLDDCWQVHAEGFKDEPEPAQVRSCFRPVVPFEQ
jgi:hypothetical protein